MTPTAVEPSGWVFPSEPERARWAAVREALASSGGVRLPVEALGNTLRERWCAAGTDPAACARLPEAHRTLSVFHYPKQHPAVFGLSFEARVPGAVAAEIAWTEGARTVAASGLSVTFRTAEGDLAIGHQLSWSIGAEIATTAAREPSALLGALVASSDGFVVAVEGLLAELEGAVHATITTGAPEKCEYAPYEGASVPPPCIRVKMTTLELADAASVFAAEVARRRALVAASGPRMHEVLRGAVPVALSR